MNTIRWILLVPGAILAWYVALFLGIVAMGVRDYFCPSEYMVSGMCTGPFGETTFSALVVLFSGISALFVVITSAVIAPKYKGYMAAAALVVGSVVAAVFLLSSNFDFWKEFVSAITFGVVTCYFVLRKHPIQPKVE